MKAERFPSFGADRMKALALSRPEDPPPARAMAQLAELWAWTLGIALLGSWTCFAALPGVNWSLWTAAAAGGFLLVSRRARPSPQVRYSRLALTLACLLGTGASVTANPRLDALTFLAVAGLFTFAVLSIATPPDRIGPTALARAPLDAIRLLLRQAAERITQTLAALRMRAAVPVIRGSTMALALATSLFLLLSAADPTMADWREVAWRSILTWTFLARDVFFILLAVLLLGGYGLAAHATPAEAATPSAGLQPRSLPSVRFASFERLIVLGAAMALFALFFGAELASQAASGGMHLASGETLAEATHRGFGQMIAAAALCALVIITLDQHALRNGRETSVRLLSWGVIAASLVAVASAYRRVHYYEMAYGYTEQRLYVQVACAAVAVALLLLAWELRSIVQLPRLMRHTVLTAIACVAGLSYWNGGAWIVHANVARYQRAGKLDVNYLERLARSSPDAIPALLEILPQLTPADVRQLRASLSLDRSSPLPRARPLRWYEWSLRRGAARDALRNAGLAATSAH
jgi:Domain of unknown function (DUF4153)